MTKLGKRLMYLSTLSFLVLGLTGCGGSGGSVDMVSVDDLTADLNLRFANENDQYEFMEPRIDVPRDYAFTFPISEEAIMIFAENSANEEEGMFQMSEVLRIYRDSAFTQEVAFSANWASEAREEAMISPMRNPVFPLRDPGVGGNLFPQGEFNDWGNANQYFLVQYYDFITGEAFDRPQVTVFNIATEIPGSVRVDFNVTEDGIAGLTWAEIPGAEEYAVVAVRENRDGRSSGRTVELLHRTSDTYWNDVHGRRDNSNFETSQATRNIDALFGEYMSDPSEAEWTLEEFLAQDWDFEEPRHADHYLYLAVIAMNSEGTSSISNLINVRDVASQVPSRIALNLNEGGIRPSGSENARGSVEADVLLAPSHVWMIMADGSARQHLVVYNTDITQERTTHMVYFEADEDGNIAHDDNGEPIIDRMEETPTLIVPFNIEGTNFQGYIQVVDHDQENYELELEELVARQEGLRSRTGDIPRSVDLSAEIDEEDKGEVATELRSGFEPRSSSPLSAYLAIQMFNGQTRISLADFPQAADHEYLVEAWFEAVLQNPLVLGARSFQLDRVTGDLFITYDQDAAIQQHQQEAIIARVDEIVDEIITPGMTELEMQTAINDFLIENATYDWGALENAERNNFMHVDPEYYDSFTAYGILINGVGVCSGYADAFTLIADAAGLDSVIVTGFLQGSLPHAWNRVSIDGNWYTLDVTNNDNEFFPNAFFNLSDAEAATILTEDTQWRLNSEIPRYVAHSDAPSEFYRYNNLFFDQHDIVDVLVEGLLQDGVANYRTDVMLTDDQFLRIAEEVIRRGGFDPNALLGGHFLGIIYLTID